MESVKIRYLPGKIITADHHAINHSADKILIKENKAIIRKLVVKDEQALTAPFCDELHFGNYE